MKTKTYTAQVKALDDGDEGTFEALVSVFGNVDHAGDRVVKGAFTKSLERWTKSGDPIPVVFSHRWDDLDAHIGEVVSAEETDEGLLIKAKLDVDDDPAAAKVHRLLTKRRIREFSFAYDVNDEKKASDGANELLDLDVIEVGPTLKGMNAETQLLGAKNRSKVFAPVSGSVEQRQADIREAVSAWARGRDGDAWAWVEATFDDSVVFEVESADGATYYQATYTVTDDGVELGEPTEVEVEATIRAASRGMKAGRVLSAANEQKLRDAMSAIAEVLAAAEAEGDPDQSSADGGDGAKSKAKLEDPAGGKGEEPGTRSPSDVRLSAEIEALELDAS